MSEKKRAVQVHLSPKTYDEFAAYARSERRSLAGQLRHLIDNYIAGEEYARQDRDGDRQVSDDRK